MDYRYALYYGVITCCKMLKEIKEEITEDMKIIDKELNTINDYVNTDLTTMTPVTQQDALTVWLRMKERVRLVKLVLTT